MSLNGLEPLMNKNEDEPDTDCGARQVIRGRGGEGLIRCCEWVAAAGAGSPAEGVRQTQVTWFVVLSSSERVNRKA